MIAYLKVALDLADTEDVKRRLQELEPVFADYDHEDATFIERINASKAARGEKPTRLSTRKKREISEYTQDAETDEAEHIRLIRAIGNPVEILQGLLQAVQSDLRFWEGAIGHYHPADRSIGEQRVQVRRRLLKALQGFLESCPARAPRT